MAEFDRLAADRLVELRAELLAGTYRPGGYVHFLIHEPKRRRISAAPFRDRVVHHALCNVIEPRFERLFHAFSFANRIGKGTHAAVDRLHALARRHRYVLRADVVKHFPSLDHDVLLATLARAVPEPDVMALVRTIVAGGVGVLDDEYEPVFFEGDDLLAACRPRVVGQFAPNGRVGCSDASRSSRRFCSRSLRCSIRPYTKTPAKDTNAPMMAVSPCVSLS